MVCTNKSVGCAFGIVFPNRTSNCASCELYEDLFVTQCGDKRLTKDISRPTQCNICEATCVRMRMRTHVGQHFLRKGCVNRHEEASLATACGFCGNRVTGGTHIVMHNKGTHALITLMLFDCLSQPVKLRLNTFAKTYASSPHTN